MTVLAGRYELGDELGAGGMATVVAAHDRVLDRPVAVKLLPPGSDPTTRERFLREARAAAQLRHPGIVAVHDTGEDAGRAFIVMELVPGASLADLLERRGPPEVEEALTITAGVLEALGEAHAAGMVHRDVKPANVLLPDGGGVKLADFGLAKALDGATGGLTTSGAVVGTPTYLAPELVDGGAPGPASDVYSVGCLLYALLAGHPPFTADSALAVAYAHRHAPVPEIEAERPDVPDAVRMLLARALQKEPADRFPDAEAMRAALLAAFPLDGQPAAAPVHTAALTRVTARPGTDTTEVVPADGPAPTRRARWLAWGVVAIVVPLALIAWALGARTGAEQDDPDGGSQVVEEPADGPPPAEGPESESEEPGPQEEPAEPDPDAEAPAEDAPAGQPPELTDAATVTELITVLADTPPGTYGEQHDDLLDDLLELSREQDPQERTEEAADLRSDIEEWVDDGELDPELGRHASSLLSEETAGR